MGTGSAFFANIVGGNMGGASLTTHTFEISQIQAIVATCYMGGASLTTHTFEIIQMQAGVAQNTDSAKTLS